MPSWINTPLGKGKIAYKLPDGTYLVVFEHGGGKIFLAEELFPGKSHTTTHLVKKYRLSYDHRNGVMAA